MAGTHSNKKKRLWRNLSKYFLIVYCYECKQTVAGQVYCSFSKKKTTLV